MDKNDYIQNLQDDLRTREGTALAKAVVSRISDIGGAICNSVSVLVDVFRLSLSDYGTDGWWR